MATVSLPSEMPEKKGLKRKVTRGLGRVKVTRVFGTSGKFFLNNYESVVAYEVTPL